MPISLSLELCARPPWHFYFLGCDWLIRMSHKLLVIFKWLMSFTVSLVSPRSVEFADVSSAPTLPSWRPQFSHCRESHDANGGRWLCFLLVLYLFYSQMGVTFRPSFKFSLGYWVRTEVCLMASGTCVIWLGSWHWVIVEWPLTLVVEA